MSSYFSSSSWFGRTFSRTEKKSGEEKRVMSSPEADPAFLHKFGVTEQLCDLVKSFTIDTFKDFNLTLEPDDQRLARDSLTETSTSSNISQDLTEWQKQHATLVLSTVKELSQLRYILCPRHLRERQFWRTYFGLVKSHVTLYEAHATCETKLLKTAMDYEKSIDMNICEVEMTQVNEGTGTLHPASEHDSESLVIDECGDVGTGPVFFPPVLFFPSSIMRKAEAHPSYLPCNYILIFKVLLITGHKTKSPSDNRS